MSEENKISLVVKGDRSTADKVGIVWEESCYLATHRVAETSGEVIEDQFRLVVCRLPTFLLPWQNETKIQQNEKIALHLFIMSIYTGWPKKNGTAYFR